MYFLDCPKEAELSRMAKESSSSFFIIIFLWQEIQSIYPGNKPSKLGEIVNPAAISTYFTERSGVYFYSISTVFRNSPARRGGYFNRISIVFLSP
jgi:hypothetical protein